MANSGKRGYTPSMTGKLDSAALDVFFRSFLDIDGYSSIDSSLNGLQVDNDGSTISKIIFAVDACQESFKRCTAAGGNMLFVHHGLFYGSTTVIKGVQRERIKFLLDNNIALYAVHLPLDQHPIMGNNARVDGTIPCSNEK